MKNYTLVLRPWALSDLDSLVMYANNWNIAKNLTDKFPFPYTESSGRGFIEYATKDAHNYLFAIDIDGQAVGSIGIHPQDDIHRKNAELGYWLAEPFWGRGISAVLSSRSLIMLSGPSILTGYLPGLLVQISPPRKCWRKTILFWKENSSGY